MKLDVDLGLTTSTSAGTLRRVIRTTESGRTVVSSFSAARLHPELFEVHKTRTVERGEFTARLDITTAGHVITWRYRGLTLTEVAASAQHPLPERRRLLVLSAERASGAIASNAAAELSIKRISSSNRLRRRCFGPFRKNCRGMASGKDWCTCSIPAAGWLWAR